MSERENGSVGVQFLVAMLLMSAAVFATASLVSGTLSYRKRSEAAYAIQKRMRDAAETAIDALGKDATPQADGMTDLFFALDGTETDGTRISIRDLSSSLNPNFVRKGLFEKTDLSRFLAPGKSPEDLQQFREDRGLSPFPGYFAAFFTQEAFMDAFGGYGWANINTSDEFALRSICREITGSDATAEAFHAKISDLLSERRILESKELRAFLGVDFDTLFPYVNAEPSMNVNFAAEAVLRHVLAYPEYGIADPDAIADSILAERKYAEISAGRLAGLLGIGGSHILLQYFGCITWFWEITTEREGQRWITVVARIPSPLAETAFSKPTFRIIESRRGE